MPFLFGAARPTMTLRDPHSAASFPADRTAPERAPGRTASPAGPDIARRVRGRLRGQSSDWDGWNAADRRWLSGNPAVCYCACRSSVSSGEGQIIVVAHRLPSEFAARVALYELDDRAKSILQAIWCVAELYLPSAIDQFIAGSSKLPHVGAIYLHHKDEFKRTEMAQFRALMAGTFDYCEPRSNQLGKGRFENRR
jgi:hypothetical protein